MCVFVFVCGFVFVLMVFVSGVGIVFIMVLFGLLLLTGFVNFFKTSKEKRISLKNICWLFFNIWVVSCPLPAITKISPFVRDAMLFVIACSLSNE